MQNKKYDLYFYYNNRKKIRDSFFLDTFPKFVKETILSKYSFGKYKSIDRLIVVSKLILISLFYFVLYKATYITDEISLVIPYAPFGLISFFSSMFLLEYNKRGIVDIEHDHYFRLLGDNRNSLLKEVMKRRINYAFLNWLIPLTVFPFIYASFVGGYEYIVFYLVFVAVFYLVTIIIVFVSQRLLFDYLKEMVVIDSIIEILFLGLLFSISIGLTVLPTIVLHLIQLYTVEVLMNVLIYASIIIALYYANLKVQQSTINYSLSNAIIQGKKSRVKVNQIQTPNAFLSLFKGNNDFQNKLLVKDLVSYYRKDKKELFTMIIWGIMSAIYSGMMISSLTSNDSVFLDNMMIDNLFVVMVSTFYIITLYRLKDSTWYSSEGSNLLMFSKFGYDKYSILKSKLKLNYIILSPFIVIYMLAPLFLTFTMDVDSVIYTLLRIPVLYLYFTNIVDYSLIEDSFNPRKTKYDVVSGMGVINLIALIVIVQGFGLTYILMNTSGDNALLNNVHNIEGIIYLLVLLTMVLVKGRFMLKRRKLKGVYEGEKVYG